MINFGESILSGGQMAEARLLLRHVCKGEVVISILKGLRRLALKRKAKTDSNSCIIRQYGGANFRKCWKCKILTWRMLTMEEQDC